MGKTFILLVSVLPSFGSGIKFHTRKIIFFPSCTIYYFPPAAHKVHFISPLVQTHPFFDLVEKKSCATREKHLF